MTKPLTYTHIALVGAILLGLWITQAGLYHGEFLWGRHASFSRTLVLGLATGVYLGVTVFAALHHMITK
ncbi:hypothetical protein [Sulfobacillus thermosulfidooxidans]|uniref:hypothetical protein n=1 Tax=Sulfobacillus thermosulfidooxidans TaxID=28034 RepID=UPI0006B648AA|nr:hypothetical protein [Sulfobacillus thermosulfidooxidans]